MACFRIASKLFGKSAGAHSFRAATPVVALNWAVVMAELGEAELALRKIEVLEPELLDFQPFYAAYAKVLEQTGRPDEARAAYQNAIDLAQSPSGRKFLENRLRQIDS
jgi:RNA polymerase sigma-70 factor (ECF subfamily)